MSWRSLSEQEQIETLNGEFESRDFKTICPLRTSVSPVALGASLLPWVFWLEPLIVVYGPASPPPSTPTATSPTWGPSGPRYPFAPLTPRGEMSLF